MKDDEKRYSRMRPLRIDQKDADYWTERGQCEERVPAAKRTCLHNATVAVAPYKAANHFQPFQGKTEITTGVTAIPSYGHTPGHTTYVIESHGQKLALLLGDTFHIEAIQFPDPSAELYFDSDAKSALAFRKKTFADAASQGLPDRRFAPSVPRHWPRREDQVGRRLSLSTDPVRGVRRADAGGFSRGEVTARRTWETSPSVFRARNRRHPASAEVRNSPWPWPEE